MRSLVPSTFASVVVLSLGIRVPLVDAQINVVTQHNDNSRTGQNLQETTLTPSNISYANFGLLTAVPVDGQIYAQPLVLSSVPIGGGIHNVVYVATENDSVYAFDATSGVQYWHISFINPAAGVTAPTSTQIGCSDITPQYGITSTPAIDTSTSPAMLYVIANTLENGVYYYKLHAINTQTGAERAGSPIVVQDPNGIFQAQNQNQRTGLLLSNGHIIFGTSAHCDHNTWYGWVFSYSATSLAREAVFVTVPAPSQDKGGVWMGGGGLAADVSGNIYFSTGNAPYDGQSSWGDSILKLQPPQGVWSVVDWYTPGDQSNLDSQDLDLGSGGVLLLPDLPDGQQLLVQAGKEGKISIIDRNNMGHYCCTSGGPDTNIVEEISGQLNGMFGSPTYSNGYIYFGADGDYLKAFSFDTTTGYVSATPVAESTFQFGGGAHQGASTSISSSGGVNGILWALDSGTGLLYGLNPSTLATLYSSDSYRDGLAPGVKFVAPTIANGMVYVGAAGYFGVYGEGPAPVWGGFGSDSGNCLESGNASVSVNQWGYSRLSWDVDAGADDADSISWVISDSSGTVASGSDTPPFGTMTVTANRLPVGTPQVHGVVTYQDRCSDRYSFALSPQ